jgi:peptidyl-prolyl cis-trans isomerase SurA
MNFQGFFLLMLGATLLPIRVTSAEVIERVEAIVNKQVVYKSDVDQFKKLAALRMKVDPFFAADPLAKRAQPSPPEIINYLINERLILDQFPVNDAEVEQEITAIQNNLRVDRDSLRMAISREGFKFEDYFQLMRMSIAKRRLIDQEIRNKATVSEDDLRAEYNRSRSGSKTFRGSFKLSLIRVTKSNFKSGSLAKESAQQAIQSIKSGTDFKEVAKKWSDDPTAPEGGELGYLSYSDMSPLLQKTVQKLGPNKTSDILDDGKSWLIIQTGDIKADVDSGFDREKENLRAKLLEVEFQHQIALWLARQRSQSHIKINQKS